MLLTCSIASAQKVLEITDVSQPNDVYSSTDNEGAVIVKCHQSIPLTFTSSMDKSARPFRTDVQGSDSVYYIAFPTGKRYRGRILTISSPGYAVIDYPLELEPKQIVSLIVTDPNATVDAGCYREHRNKGMEEIKNMNYEEARNLFVVASQCSDVDTTENNQNIALVDSILYHRLEADKFFKTLEYRDASKHYEAILLLNSYDNYASNRNMLCLQNFSKDCEMMFTRAEYFYSNKEFDKAKELYQKIIDSECQQRGMATERLGHIENQEKSRKDHASVVTYEYRKDVPFGFSVGKYNMHKAGGFFALDLNKTVADAIRSECSYGDSKFAEVNMSFGWTIKIANPLWVFFGPGFTGKLYYGKYLESDKTQKHYPGADGLAKNGAKDLDKDMQESARAEDKAKAESHMNIAPALSPVAGLCVKYKFMAVRLTYQYRYTFEKELEDFMGKQRLSVGIGFAF